MEPVVRLYTITDYERFARYIVKNGSIKGIEEATLFIWRWKMIALPSGNRSYQRYHNAGKLRDRYLLLSNREKSF